MSSSPTKHIEVHVISHKGELLGVVKMRPSRANWRMDGAPSVYINRGTQRRRARCVRKGEAWHVQLLEGEGMPSGAQPLDKYLAAVGA